MANPFRSEEGTRRYQEHLASGVLDGPCVLCAMTTIESFTYWKIVRNDFPYDLIAKEHDMIIPKRHVYEEELTEEEHKEFKQIKEEHLQRYNFIMEATHQVKSIPDHFHLHLIVARM